VSTSKPARKDRGAARAAPRPAPDPPRRILLVSFAASPITADVIRRTVDLATPEHAKITVLGIARVFGTALGLPHPGLKPTPLEWEAQRTVAQNAADDLRAQGFDVLIAMARARNAPKLIGRWVRAKRFHAVVIPDPDRPGWRRRIEGEPTKEIGRYTDVPVHAVPTPGVSLRTARARQRP
jgi:nucleotide-binding universal stress UspA family protein